MPEGDTLARTADGLRPHLVGRRVLNARARGGAQVGRLVGSRVDEVESAGKNLLMRFSNGLELRTHMRMHGSWHRYRPGERWRRPVARAVVTLEVEGAVAVCFDAPVLELFETRMRRSDASATLHGRPRRSARRSSTSARSPASAMSGGARCSSSSVSIRSAR